jgi:hypothetical protein
MVESSSSIRLLLIIVTAAQAVEQCARRYRDVTTFSLPGERCGVGIVCVNSSELASLHPHLLVRAAVQLLARLSIATQSAHRRERTPDRHA